MPNKRLAGWAQSSQNPEEVSNRVKGAIIALSSVIIFVVATVFHVNLPPESIIQLAGELGTVAGLIVSLYGAGMALVRWFATLQQ